MSASAAPALTVMESARMMRELERAALRDKTYRRYPIGAEGGRWLRSLRWSGASANTLEAYELVIARLAVDHADYSTVEQFGTPIGIEDLRDFLDRHWGEAALATRAARHAALASFFRWAVQEGRLPLNPMAAIRKPRMHSRERQAYRRDIILRLVSAQDSLRDQCALQLLARMGLRKNELRLLRIADIDLSRSLLTVHGKGGKIAVLPIGFASLRADLYLHIVGEDRVAAEHVLYPKQERLRPLHPSSLHRWFKRCLEQAGLPASIEMHELRHSAGDELWRATGNIVLAQKLLRHESVGTTQIYLHPTREDLMAGMGIVEESWRSGA